MKDAKEQKRRRVVKTARKSAIIAAWVTPSIADQVHSLAEAQGARSISDWLGDLINREIALANPTQATQQ